VLHLQHFITNSRLPVVASGCMKDRYDPPHIFDIMPMTVQICPRMHMSHQSAEVLGYLGQRGVCRRSSSTR
jgi:hypothetical protein